MLRAILNIYIYIYIYIYICMCVCVCVCVDVYVLCRVRHIFAEGCVFSCVKLDISAQMSIVGVDVCVSAC